MAHKAVFFAAQVFTNGVIDYNFSIYDGSGSYVDNCNVDLTLGTDVTPTSTGASILAAVIAEVIAFGTPHGWTLSASDFIWNGFYPYSVDEWNAIQTGIQARSFSVPTFSASTSAAQLSTTRDASVQYAYDATVSISLLAGQSVTATLKYADNSGMSTNVVTVDSQATSNSGVLGLTQSNTLKVSGIVPKGKYRQVTFAVTGSGAAAPTTLKSGQEVLI